MIQTALSVHGTGLAHRLESVGHALHIQFPAQRAAAPDKRERLAVGRDRRHQVRHALWRHQELLRVSRDHIDRNEPRASVGRRPRRQHEQSTVRRPGQHVSICDPHQARVDHLTLGASERRNHDRDQPVATDANERNRSAVRRPRGSEVHRRVARQFQWRPRANQLDPDVPVVFRLAIPGERDGIAVGRQARLLLASRIGGQRSGMPCGRGTRRRFRSSQRDVRRNGARPAGEPPPLPPAQPVCRERSELARRQRSRRPTPILPSAPAARP